jgi:ferredoxin--NADP+ reductase
MTADQASQTVETPGLPEMPEVRQHLVSPAEPVEARVVATRICTAARKAAGFVRHIDIDVSGTPLEGAWRAGQSFGVVPPGVDEKGRPHKLRLYSIAAPTGGETGDGTVLSTTVKRTIEEHWEHHGLFLGVCSNYLCDLREGDTVRLTGPAGKRFLLPADHGRHDYLFIATGTGIAPFRGMLMDLARSGYRGRATLVMGTPYRTDLLYDAELRELERSHEWFTYRTAISREITEDQPRPMYVQDRVEADAGAMRALLGSDRTLVYICGIAGMELGVLRSLWTMLPPEHRAAYLGIADDVPADPALWDRRMIPRQIKPTRRVFMEVY